MTQTALSLKGRALRHLSQREHSRAELERKLAPYEAEPGTLAQVLDELQAAGLVSHERVAQSVVHQRAHRLGGLRLKHELERKGLEPALIDAALNDLRSTELERARAVWQKKFGQAPADAQAYGRQARFLLSRGFAPELVRRVLKGPA